MKAFSAALIAVLFTSSAFADVIQCTFTEPFVDTTYSMSQQTLTIAPAGEKVQVIKNVSFQIKGPGKFELVDKSGNVLQKLELTFKGSNGMGDDVYPYEVTDSSQQKYANAGVGGCSSNYLKVIPGKYN